MGLDLDVGTFLEVHVSQNDLGSLLNTKVVHHPDGNVAHAFLSRELEHTTVCLNAHLRVTYHESHRVLDAKSGQFMKGRGRKDDWEKTNKCLLETQRSDRWMRLPTFVASVDLILANEGWTVTHVAAQKDVRRVGNAAAYIAAN